jgi:hypothetical protein
MTGIEEWVSRPKEVEMQVPKEANPFLPLHPHRNPRKRYLLGLFWTRKAARFRVRDCYPLWCDFPFASASAQLCNFPTRRQADQVRPYNPCVTTAAAYHDTQVWAKVGYRPES